MRSSSSSLLLLLLPLLSRAQIPCDDEYGAHCPEHSPDTVGGCLAALPASDVGASCKEYMAIMAACAGDIETHCVSRSAGAYTGETMGCLTSWTKIEDLTDGCRSSLPVVEEEKPREKSEAEERKAARRRRKREAAAKLAADQHPQNEKNKKKKIKKEL